MREETERLLLSFDPLIIYAAWRKSSPAQRLVERLVRLAFHLRCVHRMHVNSNSFEFREYVQLPVI